MKKFILILILLLSTALVGTYEILSLQSIIVGFVPFLSGVYATIGSLFASLRGLVPFLSEYLLEWACALVIYLVLAIAFTIVYLIFFGVIGLFTKKSRKKKFNEAFGGNPVVLTEEQQAKFDYKLYENRFPTWRLIVILLEIVLIVLFVFIRFDLIFATPGGQYGDGLYLFIENTGFIADEFAKEGSLRPQLFSNYLLPYLGTFGQMIGRWVANIYILNVGVIFQGQMYLEIICIAVVALVLILFTYALGSIFAGPIRRSKAKKRAKKSKEKYVRKLENLEYKAWVKSQKENRISEKNRLLYNEDKELDNPINVVPIATSNKEEEKNISVSQTPEQNYIDDISTGVTDLGLIEEDNNEIQKPLTSRETRFVGDEENDIVLEEEPIIETIEEEEAFYNDKISEIDDNFEKYQPVTSKDLDIEDKVKKYNIDVIEENSPVVYKEETPAIQEFEEKDLVVERPMKKTEVVSKPVKPIVVDEKPMDTAEEVIEESKEVEQEVIEEVAETEEVVELIKPKQPVVATRKKVSTAKRKPIRPVDVISDKDNRLAEYIVNTSDSSQLAMTQEELESQVNTTKATRTKTSALTRNPTNRKTTSSKKPTSAKKVASKKVVNQSTSSKIEKPNRPVSAKMEE